MRYVWFIIGTTSTKDDYFVILSPFFNGVATLAEFTQKVPRNWIKFWALSGLFTQQKVPRILKKCKQTRQGPEFERLPGHFLGQFWFVYTFFQILGTFCFVNRPERAQNLMEFLGTFWVNSANVATPLLEYQENATQARI